MNTSIKVILFDLGGVLIELGESPVPSEWLPENTMFTLSDWFSSETAVSFEKGSITAQIFAETFKLNNFLQLVNNNNVIKRRHFLYSRSPRDYHWIQRRYGRNY